MVSTWWHIWWPWNVEFFFMANYLLCIVSIFVSPIFGVHVSDEFGKIHNLIGYQWYSSCNHVWNSKKLSKIHFRTDQAWKVLEVSATRLNVCWKLISLLLLSNLLCPLPAKPYNTHLEFYGVNLMTYLMAKACRFLWQTISWVFVFPLPSPMEYMNDKLGKKDNLIGYLLGLCLFYTECLLRQWLGGWQAANHYLNLCWHLYPDLQWIKLNSLRPSDAIWRHRSGSTLAQVMASCLMAPSHYLNQAFHHLSPVTFILGQFHKRCPNHQSLKSVWKLHI